MEPVGFQCLLPRCLLDSCQITYVLIWAAEYVIGAISLVAIRRYDTADSYDVKDTRLWTTSRATMVATRTTGNAVSLSS